MYIGHGFLRHVQYSCRHHPEHTTLHYNPPVGPGSLIGLQVAIGDQMVSTKIEASQNWDLPARTGRMMSVAVGLPDGTDGCIEPGDFHGGILVARSLNRVKDCHTFIEVINVGQTPVHIKKGQVFGMFEPLCHLEVGSAKLSRQHSHLNPTMQKRQSQNYQT